MISSLIENLLLTPTFMCGKHCHSISVRAYHLTANLVQCCPIGPKVQLSMGLLLENPVTYDNVVMQYDHALYIILCSS